ncbi:putative porin [Fontisphaera persica]|uniref:putative porin n=1 Tax=Fontisphaera persica TaxID=2974023 RepID=UPI0024C09FCC|nr:putative porin [Fontisphaera persica]WCJ59937.1 putative porin [Fontisphaera persica]
MINNHFTKWFCRGLLAGCLLTATGVWGQSADALIDKLLEKGILTKQEAEQLREEADKDFRRAYSVKSGLPEWVTSLHFHGDVRVRYEGFQMPNNQSAAGATTALDRHRFRYRLRFGAVAGFWDNLQAGFRLTSGEAGATGGDPISGNSTFGNNASKKYVYIDLAYGKWTAVNNPQWTVSVTGGKMENPFVTSDMVFDKDYTPEGAALQLQRRFNDVHTLALNGGGFVLNELGGASHDSYLVGVQTRWEAQWSLHFQTSLGVSWFGVSDVQNLASGQVFNSNRGNTRTAAGALVHHYNPVYVDFAATYTLEKFWRYPNPFPIRVELDYLHNPAVQDENYGWSAGFTLGKAGKRGLWELSYRYKHLGADAFFEELVDSDFGGFYGVAPAGGAAGYGPGTNVRGHIVRLQYSPFDSTTIAVSYFLCDLINSYAAPGARASSEAGRLQVDVSWKF